MCIPASQNIPPPNYLSHYYRCRRHVRIKLFRKMSLQKKNVIQGFKKDDYVPTEGQFLVKYSSGKGNNLHEVECIDSSTILVSMPTKYRHTVWLKKDDCLVIDPIEEGKKVKGEIVCVLHSDAVRDLIENKQWPINNNPTNSTPTNVEALRNFFSSSMERKPVREDAECFPSTESSDDVETDEEEKVDASEKAVEDEDEEDDHEEKENDEKEKSKGDSGNATGTGSEKGETEASQLSPSHEDETDEITRDRNRSRVQLVSSGIVTVTNVVSEGLENDIQSLEFEADEEESSDELSTSNRDVERHANTIRIQVNYNHNGAGTS